MSEKNIALLVVLFMFIIGSFLFTTAIYAIVAWSFGIQFSWKYAIGIWFILYVLKSLFGAKK